MFALRSHTASTVKCFTFRGEFPLCFSPGGFELCYPWFTGSWWDWALSESRSTNEAHIKQVYWQQILFNFKTSSFIPRDLFYILMLCVCSPTRQAPSVVSRFAFQNQLILDLSLRFRVASNEIRTVLWDAGCLSCVYKHVLSTLSSRGCKCWRAATKRWFSLKREL